VSVPTTGISTVAKLPVPLSHLRAVEDAQFTVAGMAEGLTPYPFQRLGAGAMVLVPRMILADEMGLGKTLQFLMALKKLRDLGEVQRGLLIAKRTLLHQWVSEAEKWFPGCFRPVVIEGDKAKRRKLYQDIRRTDGHPWLHRDLVILSYSTARVDLDEIVQLPYSMVGMDEASAIRNPTAEQTKACYRICHAPQAERVVAITATPVQSRLEEYQSIMYAVDPTVLGPRATFEREFCLVDRFRINRNGRVIQVENIKGYKNLPRFKELIQDHVLQRSIEDVGAQMPELIIQDRWLDLTPLQEMRYQEIESGIYGECDDLVAVQQLIRLSQVTNAAQLIYPEQASSKLEELDDLLQNDLRGQQVVIFSKYVEMLELVRNEVLIPRGILHGTVYGGQDPHWTEQQRLRFQAGELQAMVMSTAGEEGMNLGAGKYLICMDVLYNEGRMRQLYARIRRLSSVHPQAIIIRLLCRKTVEERTLQLLASRAALIDYMDSPRHLDQTELGTLMRIINRRINLLDDGEDDQPAA
jgi:SNF2 family DNA or RNA helicase